MTTFGRPCFQRIQHPRQGSRTSGTICLQPWPSIADPDEFPASQLHQHIEPLQAGNRHIPSATFASPSMAPLTADVGPFPPMAGLQGRHGAAAGTSRSLPSRKAAFLAALKYVSVFTNQWTKVPKWMWNPTGCIANHDFQTTCIKIPLISLQKKLEIFEIQVYPQIHPFAVFLFQIDQILIKYGGVILHGFVGRFWFTR